LETSIITVLANGNIYAVLPALHENMCGHCSVALMPGPHCCVAMESRPMVAHGATVGHVKTNNSSSGRNDRKEHLACPHRDSHSAACR
jgi:hypothetical protein